MMVHPLGLGSFGNNSVLVSNATGTALASLNCTSGQVIRFDVSGYATCVSNEILQNGNSFTAAMTIGTNDNQGLNLETNGTTKMTVLANGNVGIGTITPSATLDVNGNIFGGGQHNSTKDVTLKPQRRNDIVRRL